MTDDFDNIFTEPEKDRPPNPISDQLIKSIQKLEEDREFQAKTVTLGHPASDSIINDFFRMGWHIHLMDSHQDQLLMVFCRRVKIRPKEE